MGINQLSGLYRFSALFGGDGQSALNWYINVLRTKIMPWVRLQQGNNQRRSGGGGGGHPLHQLHPGSANPTALMSSSLHAAGDYLHPQHHYQLQQYSDHQPQTHPLNMQAITSQTSGRYEHPNHGKN